MVSEAVGEQQPVFSVDTTLPTFSQYKVPSEYRQLKIKLLQLGLDLNESDLYISLLKDGPKKIVRIATEVGFERTFVYHIICGLQNKGLVAVTFKHPIEFHAVPPEKAMKILSESRRNIPKEKAERSANSLVKLFEIVSSTNSAPQSDFIVLDLDEAYSKAKEMKVNSKEQILILAHENDLAAFSNQDFMMTLQTQLHADVDLKIIAITNEYSTILLQRLNGCVRYTKNSLFESFSFIIVDKSQVLIIKGNLNKNDEKSNAIWTASEPFINALCLLFSNLWESSSHSNSNRKL